MVEILLTVIDILVIAGFDLFVNWLIRIGAPIESVLPSAEVPEEVTLNPEAIWTALLGFISGVMISLIWPARLVPAINLSGLSIPITALAVGLIMMKFGRWRMTHGVRRTFLTSFWGGAIFAGSMALTRWLLVSA